MDDDESVVEEPDVDRRKTTQRITGLIAGSAPSLKSPRSSRRGTHKVQSGSVGLRAATGKIGPAAAAVQRRADSQKVLADAEDAHRQKVWDKLDAAKKAADEKAARLKSFEPNAAAAEDDDFDDFDF